MSKTMNTGAAVKGGALRGGTFAVIDGAIVAIGKGQDPIVRFIAPATPDEFNLAPELRSEVLDRACDHVRHAKRFDMPLGTLYGVSA